MKILKIELQNINSLKTEIPITIDFESDHFKDVGLFAITGSTGAGKTTLLDAIAIALYHRVPRFNQGSATSLKDVVSYGSKEAFTRILFKVKNQRFEAFWSIRLTGNTGKFLGTPREEVRLKNLSTNKILAEKKREVQSGVEELTQLDYHQFLRSVLLAQGEFASFLSAKGPEKARLLEQITGEEVYKKIGEITGLKYAEERTKLVEISAKINKEDLLTDVSRVDLIAEQDTSKESLIEITPAISKLKTIVDWYGKYNTLNKEQTQLELDKTALKLLKENNKEALQQLTQHLKASDFKEVIQTISRLSKESEAKENLLKNSEQDLRNLKPEIEKNTKLEEEKKILLSQKETSFSEWLPKLERVSGLDIKIETEKKKKTELDKSQVVNLEELLAFTRDIIGLEKGRLEKKNKHQLLEKELKEGARYLEIEKELASWSSDLTELKRFRQEFNKDNDFCKSKEVEINKLKANLNKGKNLYTEKQTDFEVFAKKLIVCSKELENNSLTKLLEKKSALDTKKSQWSSFKDLTLVFIKNEQKLKDFILNKNRLLTFETVVSKDIKEHEILLSKSKSSLEDGERIVSLEQKVKSFENERSQLIEGEACVVCGSKDHPLVNEYKEKQLSLAIIERDKRKKKFEEQQLDLTKLGILNTKNATELNLLIKQQITLEKEQEDVVLRSKEIPVNCSLTDITKVNTILAQLQTEIEADKTAISKVQELQEKKNGLEELLKTKQVYLNDILTKLSGLKSRLKGEEVQFLDKKKSLELLSVNISSLENTLKKSLSPFNLSLPKIEETATFIRFLSNEVTSFNTKKTAIQQLNTELSAVEINLEHLIKQQSIKKGLQETEALLIIDLNKRLKLLTEDRIAVLPLETSVELKRKQLLEEKNLLKESLDDVEKRVQALLLNERTKLSQEKTYSKDVILLKAQLNKEEVSLEMQLKSSEFDSKEAVSSALLKEEDFLKYSAILKEIDTKSIQLQTLDLQLVEKITKQESIKNFSIVQERATHDLQELNNKRDVLLKRAGELTEQFKKDSEIQERNKTVLLEITSQEKELRKWKCLMDLLGGAKHSFNTYVQRLTLQNLIALANVHLFKLDRRYSLKMHAEYKTGEELNFSLVDHYQSNESRYIDTSSGGEKFIISLALALGLSDLASNNVQIESLFIDEGFGSLDNNTLETVLSTLETLQGQGKMIGVISHVENLKERIPTQIQVVKKSNGVSTVQIV